MDHREGILSSDTRISFLKNLPAILLIHLPHRFRTPSKKPARQTRRTKEHKTMLGQQIGEGNGKRTGRRVTCTEPVFKVEVAFEDVGNLGGVTGMNIGTYVSGPKPDGSLHGFGRGVFA